MQSFEVSGMTCGHCVRAVTEAVHGVDAGAKVEVDLRAGRVMVQGDAAAGLRRDAVDSTTAKWDAAQAVLAAIPTVVLDGYTGPLDHLLAMARAHKVDLSRLSLRDIADQLVAAMEQASPAVSLGQRAG